VVRAHFYGFGSDRTVGANKNAMKSSGEETANDVQSKAKSSLDGV
jgi:hypothetical protein